MNNMMIMFQILGRYDQMGSCGIDDAAEEPKRRLLIQNDFYIQLSDTW